MLMRNILCATEGLIRSYQRTQQWPPLTTLQLSDSSRAQSFCAARNTSSDAALFSFSDLYVNAVLGLMWTGVNIHGGYLN